MIKHQLYFGLIIDDFTHRYAKEFVLFSCLSVCLMVGLVCKKDNTITSEQISILFTTFYFARQGRWSTFSKFTKRKIRHIEGTDVNDLLQFGAAWLNLRGLLGHGGDKVWAFLSATLFTVYFEHKQSKASHFSLFDTGVMLWSIRNFNNVWKIDCWSFLDIITQSSLFDIQKKVS